MSLKYQQDLSNFFLTQLLTIIGEFVIIFLYYQQERYIIPFCYSFPCIIGLMVLYYFMFWRPTKDRSTSFLLINLLLFTISSAFYYIYFSGMFNKTLQYEFTESSTCNVIGKESIQLGKSEMYSILYINFERDGERMLGYACQSSQSEASIHQEIFPNEFYYYQEKIACDEEILKDHENQRHLTDVNRHKRPKSNSTSPSSQEGQEELDLQEKDDKKKYFLSEGNGNSHCFTDYVFSEVKLPSWMCIPSSVSYESLIEPKTCFIEFYGNRTEAEQNSQNRESLKSSKSFVMISYDQLPVPFHLFMIFLILDFNVFIISLNLFTQFIASCFSVPNCVDFKNNQQLQTKVQTLNNNNNNNNKEEQKESQLKRIKKHVKSKLSLLTMRLSEQNNKIQSQLNNKRTKTISQASTLPSNNHSIMSKIRMDSMSTKSLNQKQSVFAFQTENTKEEDHQLEQQQKQVYDEMYDHHPDQEQEVIQNLDDQFTDRQLIS